MTESEWLGIFSKKLIDKMCERGYSVGDLAEDTGLSKSAISYYINGARVPGVRAIINISRVLGCTVEELVNFGEKIES